MNNYSPSRAKFMYRVSLRVLFTTIVLLPGLARAQRSPGVLRDIGVRNAPDIGNRISTGSRQPLGRSGLSVVFAPTLRQPVESDNPVPLVVTSQFGIHSVSQSTAPLLGIIGPYHTYSLANQAKLTQAVTIVTVPRTLLSAWSQA
jgi:hypothetical protein